MLSDLSRYVEIGVKKAFECSPMKLQGIYQNCLRKGSMVVFIFYNQIDIQELQKVKRPFWLGLVGYVQE